MKDQILRAYNSEVRVVAIRTTETVEEARARHGTSATATAAASPPAVPQEAQPKA